MIAALVSAITLLLAALILSRRVFPEFRRRSELPKYRFLADLGIKREGKS
jgi:cytochrome bd-type quinol oxidase subunit 2